MEEKDGLKIKLFKLIISNILILLTMFLIFGLFIFFMIKNSVYTTVDKELYETKMQILEIDTMFELSKDKRPGGEIPFFGNALKEYRDYAIRGNAINPNVIMILRNENGEIVTDEFNRFYNYSAEINFDLKNLDKIYDEEIAGEFHYRGINFEISTIPENSGKYVQLLINVDSERMLLKGYLQIIGYSIVIICGLSLIVSYFISKKTLAPLKESMTKQMEFVQNVSHELRTPLTIIQAKQELLLQEPNSKIIDKSEDIVLTLNETKRLSKLVKDLLVLSRADNQKMTIQKELVNIDDYIKEIVSPYIEIAELEEKKINLNFDYKMDINIDANKIYQLMIILLDNAIKYTETGDEIEINTYSKDNKCVIEIKDTGIGVSDEGLKRIFERFYREDSARNRETGGTGLGLSIASMIVNAHNGTIKASHNQPKGTIFTIRLPK